VSIQEKVLFYTFKAQTY